MDGSARSLGYVVRASGLSGLIGVIAIVPFLVGVYSFQQSILVPLGLAHRDPTFNDNPAVGGLLGILVSLALIVIWAAAMRNWARSSAARNRVWAAGSLALVLPIAVFLFLKD